MKTHAESFETLFGYDVWSLGRVITNLHKIADEHEDFLAIELSDLEQHLSELRKLVERLRALNMVA